MRGLGREDLRVVPGSTLARHSATTFPPLLTHTSCETTGITSQGGPQMKRGVWITCLLLVLSTFGLPTQAPAQFQLQWVPAPDPSTQLGGDIPLRPFSNWKPEDQHAPPFDTWTSQMADVEGSAYDPTTKTLWVPDDGKDILWEVDPTDRTVVLRHQETG